MSICKRMRDMREGRRCLERMRLGYENRRENEQMGEGSER